jgi:hypothetical protein
MNQNTISNFPSLGGGKFPVKGGPTDNSKQQPQ